MIEILIIGSGPAGYTAGIYAARAGRKVRLLTGPNQGGQLMITHFIENFPGFLEPITGPELMDRMNKHALQAGVEIETEVVQKVDFLSSNLKVLTESGRTLESQSVIIATGANARWLDVAGENYYRGRGVSACATCDGFFFRNKHVAVIGGGNSAAEEALFLSNFAKKVTLIHRRDELRAEKILQNRLFSNEKIEVLWNKETVEICGDSKKVTHVKLVDTVSRKESTLEIDGIFVAIGHAPATEIFNDAVELNSFGYIVLKDRTATSQKGVFAAGDVCDFVYRQAITSAAQGCMAAIDADKFLSVKF